MFAHASDHHGGGRDGVWIKATRDNQALMIHSDASRFFFPPYVGPGGWVGVYLDEDPDWGEVADLLRDGWRMIGPRKLVREAAAPGPPAKPRRAPRRHR